MIEGTLLPGERNSQMAPNRGNKSFKYPPNARGDARCHQRGVPERYWAFGMARTRISRGFQE